MLGRRRAAGGKSCRIGVPPESASPPPPVGNADGPPATTGAHDTTSRTRRHVASTGALLRRTAGPRPVVAWEMPPSPTWHRCCGESRPIAVSDVSPAAPDDNVGEYGGTGDGNPCDGARRRGRRRDARVATRGAGARGIPGDRTQGWRGLSALVETERFNVAILDKELPGPNGLDLLSFLRQRLPEVPVILVTAFGGPDVQHEAARRGASGYVEKPFRVATLLDMLSTVLMPLRGGEPGPPA